MSPAQTTQRATDVDGSLIWQELQERIDALIAAWQSAGEPPNLAEFLPEGDDAVRRLALIEAIKVDLEYRWQADKPGKRVEEYLAEFPELAAGGHVPCDVIYEEYHVRRQRGDSISLEEYCGRFPDRSEELRRLVQWDAKSQSTVLVVSQRVPTFESGQKVDDFDLIRPLGKGAFATVFLARQISMQRLVALKISADRGFEPQTLAQLDHPHIVRVYDQRQLAEGQMRLLYMQYVAGGTLQGIIEHARQAPPGTHSGATLLQAIDAALERGGETPPVDSLTRYRLQKMTWPQAVCWLGARMAAGLDYAHQRGVLHRDVKPANVLIGADGHPKLADFNISFSKVDGATPAAYFGGSLAYMSPEQLEAFDPAHARQPDELDSRADVYSLGVLLWELLTLARPFVDSGLQKDWGDQLKSMIENRRAGVTPEMRAKATQLGGPMVAATLLGCLEPDVQDRYASAGELARELDLCLQPRAHALMRGHTWGAWLRKHPVRSTVLFGLVPNVLMSVLSIVYNWGEVVAKLAEASRFFQVQIAVVNLTAYTVGLSYVVATRGKTFVALSRLAGGKKLDDPPDGEMMRRLLTLGAAVGIVTALLWAVSGFIFPVWMQYGSSVAGRLSGVEYRHFIASNLLCGLIAATQTYYVVTFFCVRYCYPWLLAARGARADEMGDLADVVRRGRLVLGMTVFIPFAALTALVLINFKQSVIASLGVLGLLGCGLAYWLDLAIRQDVAALAAAISPMGDSLGDADSVESYHVGSRRG